MVCDPLPADALEAIRLNALRSLRWVKYVRVSNNIRSVDFVDRGSTFNQVHQSRVRPGSRAAHSSLSAANLQLTQDRSGLIKTISNAALKSVETYGIVTVEPLRCADAPMSFGKTGRS